MVMRTTGVTTVIALLVFPTGELIRKLICDYPSYLELYDAQCTKRALMQLTDNVGPDEPMHRLRLIRDFIACLQNALIL